MNDPIWPHTRRAFAVTTLLLALALPSAALAQSTTGQPEPGAAASGPPTGAAGIPLATGTAAAPDLASALQGSPPATSGSPLRPEGGNVWGLFYGFGFNQSIAHSAPGIQVATAGVRWSHLWPAKFGSFLRGHPAFAIEIVPVETFVQTDRTTWAVGGNLLYEHHFATSGRVLPVWRIGAGFLYANKQLPEGETRHNFSLLTALGVDVMVNDRGAVFLGYRFHHVSNANSGPVNPGINTHTVVIGVSFYR